MFFNRGLSSMLIGVVTVLLSITIHELAHGYVAYKLGDNTAKNQGRLTLNPIAHLDPLGAILMFLTGFGWAKPVPINPFFFKGDRKKGVMLVSIAGPLANILLAFVIALCLPMVYKMNNGVLLSALASALYLNIYLAIFNLLPVPPLDGSKILAGFLPRQTAMNYLNTMEKYGFLILMLLVVFGVIRTVVSPVADGIYGAFINLAFMLLGR